MTSTLRSAPSPHHTGRTTALACAAIAGWPGSSALAQPVALGPEVSIDSLPGIYYRCPVLAGHDDGSFAAAWARVQINADTDLAVRAGDPSGTLAEARSAAFTKGNIVELFRLAATPTGYTVLWQGFDQARRPFLARELDASGANVGKVVDLARHTLEVSPRPVGGFVATWVDAWPAVNVQLLDARGDAEASPVRLAVPGVAWSGAVHRADGEHLVFWRVFRSEPASDGGLAARRFDAFGRPTGTTVRLIPPPGARRRLALFALAWGDDGTIAAAWTLEPSFGRVGRKQLLLRTFDEAGRALQKPVLVASASSHGGPELVPSGLAVDAAGNALLTWVTFDLGSATTRALVLLRGARTVEPFDLASAASAGYDDVTCAAVAAAGASWIVLWMADDRATAAGPLSSRLFLRRFAR